MNNLRRLFCRVTALSALVTTVSVAAPIVVPGERAYPENLSASSDGTLYIGRAGDGGIVRTRPGSPSEMVPDGGVYISEGTGEEAGCSALK